MRGASRKKRLLFAAALLAVIHVEARLVPAQTQSPPTLPANWQQLSPTDFATVVRQHFDTFKSLSEADQEDLATHGAELFVKIDISNTPLNYQTLEMLEWVGRGNLDQNTVQNAKIAVMARQDNWAGQPYAEIRAKVAMMMRLKVPEPVLISEARRWAVAGGTLAQVPKNDLAYDIVRQVASDVRIISGSFSAEWVGQIRAPQTGDYTFFVSPIDVNLGFQIPKATSSMTLFLAGQAIISASPPTLTDPLSGAYQPNRPKSNWVSQSNAVSLTAGTPVAIRVLVTVDAPNGIPDRLLHATLLWQGPGIAKSVVPESALSQAQTGNPGLQATYTWTEKGQPQSLTRTDPAIDFAWMNPHILLEQDTSIAGQSVRAMWQALTSSDFVTAYATATPPRLHPFLLNAGDASCGLSTVQRQAFLDLLLQNPTLLDPMDPKLAVRFFAAFRVGTPDKALDVFGVWASRHADISSQLTTDRVFEGDERFAYGNMATFTTQQLPGQAERLRTQYLQLPDGRCSLPVAYTLACSYLGLKKYSDWTALLDGKLADPALIGDVRVNWLLARANAAELDPAWAIHYPENWAVPAQHPMWGRRYLAEALASAQSSTVKLRVTKEILARLVWAHRLKAAGEFLQAQAISLPNDAKPTVATWQKLVAGLITADAASPQLQATASRQAHLNVLKARRDKAASVGDSAGVDRYNALINAAGNNP
jgi:PA14 domain